VSKSSIQQNELASELENTFIRTTLRLARRGTATDFGNDVFPAALDRGLALYAKRATGYVMDIGSIDRYAQAEADLRNGRVLAGPASAAALASTGGSARAC